jgi:hypothetical protein
MGALILLRSSAQAQQVPWVTDARLSSDAGRWIFPHRCRVTTRWVTSLFDSVVGKYRS